MSSPAHNLEPAMKPEEVAILLRVSKREVYELAAGGLLSGFRVGRLLRIRPDSVRALLNGGDPPPSNIHPFPKKK